MKSHHWYTILFLVVASYSPAFSQTILLNDFSNWLAVNPNGGFATNSWDNLGTYQVVQETGYISIEPVSGGDPQGDGTLYADVGGTFPKDLSGFGFVTLTLRLQPTNTNTSFTLAIADTSGNQIGSADFVSSLFNTASFTTVTAVLSVTVPASINDVGGIFLYGDGSTSTLANFDVTEATATVVPEPATWALLAGSLTTVMIFRRRRS